MQGSTKLQNVYFDLQSKADFCVGAYMVHRKALVSPFSALNALYIIFLKD